jgi:DNA-binding NtrC family response regulator
MTDVRLIAATHRNLALMVKDGRFRDDLLFRINTLTLDIPPLRKRSSDIRPLAQAVLKELCRRRGRTPPELAEDAVDVLGRYHWPGNVRELRNVLERAMLFCKGDTLDRHTLRFDRSLEPDSESDPQTLDDAERRHIALVLKQTGGKVDDAAKVLALSRSSLYAKLKKYGIRPADS